MRVRLIAPAVAIFVLLHVAAAAFFPDVVWGAHHARFLPLAGQILWGAGCIALFVPRSRRMLEHAGARAVRIASERPRVAASGGALVALVLFLVFRSRNQFSGDGMLVASIVSDPAQSGADRAGYVVMQLHKAVLAALRIVRPTAPAESAFAVVSAVCGVGVLASAWLACRDMFATARARVLCFAAVATCGGIALFFGHVEDYPVLHFMIAAYVCLGIARLRQHCGLLWPSIALSAATLAHPLGIALAPSWICLLRRADFRSATSWLASAVVAAAGVVWVSRASSIGASTYGGSAALLPLFHAGEERAYALFSLSHFGALANELLLVVGGAIMLPLLALPRIAPVPSRGATRLDAGLGSRDPRITRFLVVACAGTLLAMCAVDPKFGGRDWDLLALPCLPIIFLLGYASLAGREAPDDRATVLLVGAMILHTLPWIWVNTSRDRSVEMIVSMVASDAHYTKPGQKGYRFLGRVLQDAGYRAESWTACAKAAEISGYAVDQRNWARHLMQEERYDEAVGWLARAMNAAPTYGEARRDLATCYARLDRLHDAESVLRKWLADDPGSADAHLSLVSLLLGRGEADSAITFAQRSIDLDPTTPGAWHALSIALSRAGRSDEAEAAATRERALLAPAAR